MSRTVNIGHVWAVCDHFEGETGKPTPASMLKKVCGVDRKQLRKWAHDGRLVVFDIYDSFGRLEKGYMRPKAREGGKSGAVEQVQNAT